MRYNVNGSADMRRAATLGFNITPSLANAWKPIAPSLFLKRIRQKARPYAPSTLPLVRWLTRVWCTSLRMAAPTTAFGARPVAPSSRLHLLSHW